MEIIKYIIAMFGGTYQYDPVFFWSTLSLMLIFAVISIYIGEKVIMKHRHEPKQ